MGSQLMTFLPFCFTFFPLRKNVKLGIPCVRFVRTKHNVCAGSQCLILYFSYALFLYQSSWETSIMQYSSAFILLNFVTYVSWQKTEEVTSY